MTEAGLRRAVFVSFASPDIQTARLITDQLDAAGLPSFFAPRDIAGGMNFALEIVKAISSCDALVVLLSPASVHSPHVRREVSLAIDERRIVLPVALPGTSFPAGLSTEWIYWLSALQVMEYDGPEHLVARVRSLLSRDPSSGRQPPQWPVALAPLPAARRQLSRRHTGPSSLLRPESELPALIGRERELARLEQWCLRDDDFDIRIVTGGAGEGKTRLAFELMRNLRANGWQTQIAASGASGSEIVVGLRPQPTLLVMDYAETRSDQVFDLLNALLDQGVHDRLRVLLLARSAGDWWNAFLARDADVADLVADVTVQPLESLASDRDAANQLFVAAMEQFARQLGLTAQTAVGAPYRHYTTALEVLEDALVTVLGDSADSVGGTSRLLAHERRYLAASARAADIDEVDDVDLNRIAAGLTLFGAASEDDAVRIVGECNSDLNLVTRRRVARLFRRLYPGLLTYVEGLRPDLLAEDLLAGILSDENRLPAASEGLASASRTMGQRRRALTLLARGATRHPTIAAELEKAVLHADLPMLELSIKVATQMENPDRLTALIVSAVQDRSATDVRQLVGAVPDETVVLADLAARLSRRILDDLPTGEEQTIDDVVTAMNCSNRFSDAGWSTEAAESAQVAVDRLRMLNPVARDQRILGRALANLSNRLWERGDLADSVASASEAVVHLSAAGSSVAERVAVRSNLAFRLAEVGRFDQALTEAREAEKLCPPPNTEEDPALTKTRGTVMNNLSCILLANGDVQGAQRNGESSVRLRRSQALQDRDRFLPYVARALANAAPAAEAGGNHDLADRFLIEARTLHRLTGGRAPIFRFEEAESATLGALILLGRSRWEAAEEAANHALDMLSSLTVDLGDLESRLRGSLEATRSSAASHEAVSVLDVARGCHPEIHLPRLLEYRDL